MLANKIEELCQKKKVSVNSMLADCGLPSSTLHNIKQGSKPSYDKLEKIADYFDVTVDYLLGRDTKLVTDEELKFALFGGENGISDEQLAEVKKYAAYVLHRDEGAHGDD